MLQEVKDLQKRAVEELFLQSLYKHELTFKAPTGSGKTYIMADFMNKVLSQQSDIIFLVSTLSKGDLAMQNYEKFCDYSQRGFFQNLKPYLITSEKTTEERLFIPTDYNVYLLPRDLYKKSGKLMQGAMENFLQTLTLNRFFGGLNKKIYLIKDECHIATNNLDSLSEKNFEKIFNFSATPNLRRGQNPDVEISYDEAVKSHLIKHIEFGNENDTVADAIRKFEEIKVDYRNLLGVNPCLIIQISNKDKANYELNNVIFPELNKAEHQDLKWMLIVDDEKSCNTNDIFKAKKLPISKWKDYAKQNTATIDIIIFKMVISEGWDIPRACMLYQIRDSQSKQLDEQVMGRVRRNPRLLDFETLSSSAQKLATTAWIWGIVPEDKSKIYSVKLFDEPDAITNELKVKTTKLKALTNREDFNLQNFLDKQSSLPSYCDIFSLYKKLNKAENNIKEMCYAYSDTINKWWQFTENIENISKENIKYICDYTQSMEVVKDEAGNSLLLSLPTSSFYVDNGNYTNISDWVWRRNDGKDKFSFDSDAEREWAEILNRLCFKNTTDGKNTAVKKVLTGKNNPHAVRINIFNEIEPQKHNPTEKFLWGKNFIYNSQIKFEYYLNGIHSSYPDFVMKDSFNRIHIFEVKSVNKSNSFAGKFENEQYKLKIKELKKCYKQSSLLTGHIFYLPVLKDDIWHITQFLNGNEQTISKEQFFDFVTTQ